MGTTGKLPLLKLSNNCNELPRDFPGVLLLPAAAKSLANLHESQAFVVLRLHEVELC
jgi:hypothetical protein